MPVVRYVAKHKFKGNSAASQLSFSKGDILVCDAANQAKDWVWCTAVKNSESGWCPLSYLVPEGGPLAPSKPSKAPWYAEEKSKSQDIDEGFGGSIMGGSSTSQATPFAVAEPVPTNNYNDNNQQQEQANGPNRWSQIGSNIQTAGRHSWTAVSNGAQRAGAAVSNGAQRAGQAMAGNSQPNNQQQEQRQQQRPSWMDVGKKPRAQQKAVNVGNYAARGAVVGAAKSVIFNPSIGGLVRGVKHGVVKGGAYGLVKDWKPFG